MSPVGISGGCNGPRKLEDQRRDPPRLVARLGLQ